MGSLPSRPSPLIANKKEKTQTSKQTEAEEREGEGKGEREWGKRKEKVKTSYPTAVHLIHILSEVEKMHHEWYPNWEENSHTIVCVIRWNN